MKRHLSDSEPENCDDYEECSSPDTIQISRKKRRGVIEKRRRDRINNCLMELRRLVPQAFEKQGSAKLEKAEILQMTVEHLRHLHTRDPRGFSDPYAAYGNTRAFLDYRIMGIRECVAESARYLTSVEGVDMKDPMRIRLLNHLENFLSQRELAVNAAVAANAHNTQLAMPKVATTATAGTPVPIPTVVTVPALPAVTAPGHPYAPLTPPRASPDNLSPPANVTATSEPLPRFSVAFPAGPIISFAPTANVPVPVFRTGPSSFKPVVAAPQSSVKTVAPLPTAITSTTAAAKPLNVIMTANKTTDKIVSSSNPSSPQKTTRAPFRPWADTMTTADSS